jgi:hypothetical protein
MNANLIAGVAAGIAGLIVFLILHHLWIAPIWFILPFGLVVAAAGGAAVGWAYGELLPNLPPRPWTILAVVGLIAVILLPSIILAELREPLFDITVPGGRLQVGTGRAALVFVLEFLLTATLVGGTPGVAKELAMKGCLDASCNSMGVPYLESTKSCISLAVFSGCPNHGT